MFSLTQKKCPSGYTYRRGYTRKLKNETKREGFTVRRDGKLFTVKPKKSLISVPAKCVPIKKKSTGKMSVGSLRKGNLIKFGYSYRLPDSSRRKALKKAIEAYGATGVYKKLETASKLAMKTAPDASIIFSKDRDWVYSHYMMGK
jgi:hypothetical protein